MSNEQKGTNQPDVLVILGAAMMERDKLLNLRRQRDEGSEEWRGLSPVLRRTFGAMIDAIPVLEAGEAAHQAQRDEQERRWQEHQAAQEVAARKYWEKHERETGESHWDYTQRLERGIMSMAPYRVEPGSR